MSKIDLIMTQGIQKYIENEKDLLDIMIQDTKGTQWEIVGKETLTVMPPPILYYYLERASQVIANKK